MGSDVGWGEPGRRAIVPSTQLVGALQKLLQAPPSRKTTDLGKNRQFALFGVGMGCNGSSVIDDAVPLAPLQMPLNNLSRDLNIIRKSSVPNPAVQCKYDLGIIILKQCRVKFA